jgi:hypothetical protein
VRACFALLKEYRRLLLEASVEEIKRHDIIMTTCAVAGSQRVIKGTEGRVFQVRLQPSG